MVPQFVPPVHVTLQVNVCVALSGTATTVNCCARFCPTVTVVAQGAPVGVTTAETCDTLSCKVPAIVLTSSDVAVIVTAKGDVFGAVVAGAW